MTPTTLQALRSLLFFSCAEAAALVGRVDEDVWSQYEAGKKPVPEDVALRITELVSWRANTLKAAEDTMAQFRTVLPEAYELDAPILVWYASIDDWMTLPGREPVLWRPRCSAVAELCARHNAIAVPFDGPAYAHWLAGRHDSETMRGIWAAEQ